MKREQERIKDIADAGAEVESACSDARPHEDLYGEDEDEGGVDDRQKPETAEEARAQTSALARSDCAVAAAVTAGAGESDGAEARQQIAQAARSQQPGAL